MKSGGREIPIDGAVPEKSIRPAGNLLKPAGLLALAAVLVLAAWFSQAGILLLSALFLSTAGLARLWSFLALAGVRLERRFKGQRHFPGELIECAVSLANRKPLPLPWVEIEIGLPEGIVPFSPAASPRPSTRLTAALLGYRGISWELRLTGARRGYYPVGPPRATAGDILGLYARTRHFGRGDHLIVFPRLFPLDARVIPTLHPMGELRSARRLFQDPTHTLGVREYLPGDSLRRIHWKATARRGDLQVKEIAATTAFKVAILLDVGGFRTEERLDEENFELAVSTAGSLAAALTRSGNPAGLYVNTRLADSDGPAVIPPAAGRERLGETLEALAKVTGRLGPPLTRFIDDHKAGFGAGTTLVLILGRPPETLAALAASLLQSGLRIMVVLVGRHPDPDLPERTYRHRIADADALGAWRPEGSCA